MVSPIGQVAMLRAWVASLAIAQAPYSGDWHGVAKGRVICGSLSAQRPNEKHRRGDKSREFCPLDQAMRGPLPGIGPKTADKRPMTFVRWRRQAVFGNWASSIWGAGLGT